MQNYFTRLHVSIQNTVSHARERIDIIRASYRILQFRAKHHAPALNRGVARSTNVGWTGHTLRMRSASLLPSYLLITGASFDLLQHLTWRLTWTADQPAHLPSSMRSSRLTVTTVLQNSVKLHICTPYIYYLAIWNFVISVNHKNNRSLSIRTV